MKALGLAAYDVSLAGSKGAESMIAAFGGLDKLQAASSSYYDNFYVDSEKLKLATGLVSDAFTAAGQTMPATRDGLRKLVEEAKAAGDDKTYAALINLSASFAQVVPPAEDLAIALGNVNKGIQSQIDSLGNSMLSQAQLRAQELTGVDASTAALLNRLYALQDQKTAEDALTSAMTAAASERYSLETELLNLQGDTTQLRQRELDLIAPANRALKQQIYDLQDQAKAAEQAQKAADVASQAAQQAQQAAQQITAAWQSVTNSLFDEVTRARGLITGNSAQSLAGAQAQFSITNAQALSGDQEAAKLLPKLSQALLAIAEQQAPTLEALNRIRASTAGTLESTANSYAKYGVKLPSFDVGTDYVPHDMIAQIHRGEKITPAAFNRSGQNDELVNALIAEVRELKAIINVMVAPTIDNEKNTRKLKENIQRVTHDGEEMQSRVLA
jgi:hypothetical protein